MRRLEEWVAALSLVFVVLGLAVLAGGECQRARAYPLVAACDADANSVINSADLGLVAMHFNTAGPGDINLDGVVNSADLAWCGRLFGTWAYPEGPNPDDSIELPTVTTEGLSLEEQATATAQAGICPECVPAPTAGAQPTP